MTTTSPLPRSNLVLHIRGDTITSVYDERLDLRPLGAVSIRRGSHVEPDEDGRWWASMVGGPVLGPFELRSQAITAEVEWLRDNLTSITG